MLRDLSSRSAAISCNMQLAPIPVCGRLARVAPGNYQEKAFNLATLASRPCRVPTCVLQWRSVPRGIETIELLLRSRFRRSSHPISVAALTKRTSD